MPRLTKLNRSIAGRVAIVTGAASGMGRATAHLFADEGAKVAVVDRVADGVERVTSEITGAGGTARGYTLDVSEVSAIPTTVERVRAELGPVDILVNNVGASPSRNFLYMSDDDWEQLHELNLMSAVRCTRRWLPAMRKQRWGRVVMIATSGAVYPNAALIDYAATKAGMIAMAEALAGKYGGDGVLVNTILPGLIHTAMWDRAAREIADASGSTAADVLAGNSRGVPVGRYGTAEEVAAAVVFLCSNAASYINGVALSVDGGSGGHV